VTLIAVVPSLVAGPSTSKSILGEALRQPNSPVAKKPVHAMLEGSDRTLCGLDALGWFVVPNDVEWSSVRKSDKCRLCAKADAGK
jgi:hypothetical protein